MSSEFADSTAIMYIYTRVKYQKLATYNGGLCVFLYKDLYSYTSQFGFYKTRGYGISGGVKRSTMVRTLIVILYSGP